jgi:hypothetical protein
MADSGEDVNANGAVILQHVISGMVLVAIRHLPAIDSNTSTYDEEYLSDEDNSATADGQTEEKWVVAKRNKLDVWIETFMKAIADVLEYCSHPIRSDFTITSYLADNHIVDEDDERQPIDEEQFLDEDDDESQSESQDGKNIRVERWIFNGQSIQTYLKEAEASLMKTNDLTRRSIHDKSVEIEHEVEAWLNSCVYRSPSGRKYSAAEVIDHILAQFDATVDDRTDGESQSGRSFSGQSANIHGTKSLKDGHSQIHRRASTVGLPSVKDGSSVHGTEFDESASHFIKLTKSALHPLQALDRYIEKFKKRDKKNKKTEGSENPWTFHIMTPKRILKYRNRLSEVFSSMSHERSAPFLISCRWSLSTRHEKVRRKDGESSIKNTTLFGLEVFDLSKDQLFLIGATGNHHGQARSETDSLDPSSKRWKDLAVIPLGQLSGKGLDPQVQSEIENQLFNVEFVSVKSADQIRNGSQVSSIIRNFCSQLSVATEKRDLDFYLAFLRRYHSRLTEAFDVVARSCVYNGFQKDCNVHLADIDHQGQLFFGSLGVIELVFSVIQVFKFFVTRFVVHVPTSTYHPFVAFNRATWVAD